MTNVSTRAAQVIAATTKAWKVAPVSPLALPRQAPHGQAPHGHVPLHVVCRVQVASAASHARHPAQDASW